MFVPGFSSPLNLTHNSPGMSSLPNFLFGPQGIFTNSSDFRVDGNVSHGASFEWSGGTHPPPPPAEEDTTASTHAASRKGLRALPKIKVTPYDREQNESTECVICLSELVVGEPATRIPCGHLYHEDCILAWLKEHNDCPVCRYELPTDDAAFEQGRKARMAGRKPRLRHADLKAKTAQELCRLAEHLDIDVRRCLEKAELVDCIVRSGKLEVVPEPMRIHMVELNLKTNHQLRRLAEQLRVDIRGCLEKAELINSLIASGRLEVITEPLRDSRPPSVTSSAQVSPMSASASASALASLPSQAELGGMNIHEIKYLMRRLKLETNGCLEKEDLIHRILASGASPSSPSSQSYASMTRPQSVNLHGDRSPSLQELDATSMAKCSIAQLRNLARSKSVSLDGCLEKADIIQRILSDSSSPAGGGELNQSGALIDSLDHLAATGSRPCSRSHQSGSRPSSRSNLRHAGSSVGAHSNITGDSFIASQSGEISHLASMGNLSLRGTSRPGSASSSTITSRHTRSLFSET